MVRRLALLLSFVPAIAFAVGVEETIPKTRNTPLMVTPERAKFDPFSGGTTYGYSIAVPPGTGGSTPNLTLSYSSLTKSTEYGFGWNLSLSKIERSTRFGAPKYDAPATGFDQFELDGELLARDPAVPAAGAPKRFYQRQHDGSRAEYFAIGDYWEVARPDGTKLRFGFGTVNPSPCTNPSGQLGNARLAFGSNLIGATFRWALSEVIDPSGNSYKVEYEPQCDASFGRTAWVANIYPRRVRYFASDGV